MIQRGLFVEINTQYLHFDNADIVYSSYLLCICYNIPCAIIAWATLRNPATFAPFT